MRVLIGLCATLLLAVAGCSKTDDSADQTAPTTTPGAPGDVTGGAQDTAPPADTTTMPPADPSTTPPADQTTPPADETTPPQQ